MREDPVPAEAIVPDQAAEQVKAQQPPPAEAEPSTTETVASVVEGVVDVVDIAGSVLSIFG